MAGSPNKAHWSEKPCILYGDIDALFPERQNLTVEMDYVHLK